MAHSLRGQPIMLEGHGSRTGRQWVGPMASAVQKQRDERCRPAHTFLLIPFRTPAHGIVMPTAKTCTEVCLLHVSRACKVDRINHCRWYWQQLCHMALALL